MNITPINNTTFQARLDISGVKANKERWVNIAKVFKNETKLIPDETIKVIEHEFDTSIIGSTYEQAPNIGKIEAITFNETMKELLSKFDDNTIAKKLIKLMNIGEIANSRKEKAYEKYQALADKISWEPRDKFLNQRFAEYEKIDNAALNKTKKDAFWKNFEVII